MKIREILFGFLMILSVNKLAAQNTEMIKDTVLLHLDGYKEGQIQWQLSTDNINWKDIIGETNIQFKYILTENCFFRAKIVVGKCINYSEISKFILSNTIFKRDVFVKGELGYAYFRLPTIIKTKSNRLLVFAEGRKVNEFDTGNLDIVMKYSDDLGRSWSILNVLWNDGGNTCGNPSPVFDVIWLITCWNNGNDSEQSIMRGKSVLGRKVFSLYSNNDGFVWSKPNEITPTVKNVEMKWYATGPCHGIQLKNNTNKNRLILPCCHSIDSTYSSHIIYSDDYGINWKLGGIVPNINNNESTIAELENGNLILNMRNYDPTTIKYRTLSYSTDAGMTWTPSKANKTLIEPTCQGSMINLQSDSIRQPTLLFVNPSSKSSRSNLTVKASYDDGITWSSLISVNKGLSGYSDMTEVSLYKIGIVYENGTDKTFDKISYSLVKF